MERRQLLSRQPRRLHNIITVKGEVADDRHIKCNLGLLYVRNALHYYDCNFFELWRDKNKFLIRNAFKLTK
jgi:hypothetical protein